MWFSLIYSCSEIWVNILPAHERNYCGACWLCFSLWKTSLKLLIFCIGFYMGSWALYSPQLLCDVFSSIIHQASILVIVYSVIMEVIPLQITVFCLHGCYPFTLMWAPLVYLHWPKISTNFGILVGCKRLKGVLILQWILLHLVLCSILESISMENACLWEWQIVIFTVELEK